MLANFAGKEKIDAHVFGAEFALHQIIHAMQCSAIITNPLKGFVCFCVDE